MRKIAEDAMTIVRAFDGKSMVNGFTVSEVLYAQRHGITAHDAHAIFDEVLRASEDAIWAGIEYRKRLDSKPSD